LQPTDRRAENLSLIKGTPRPAGCGEPLFFSSKKKPEVPAGLLLPGIASGPAMPGFFRFFRLECGFPSLADSGYQSKLGSLRFSQEPTSPLIHQQL